MLINTDNLVSITEANQNFSKLAKNVDENGAAVILKNNAPKYILFSFDEFMAQDSAQDNLSAIAERILYENLDAFKRLAE